MELGTLPEWFTACAEVLAVCTALFLPRYTAFRERRASYERMHRVLVGLLNALMRDLGDAEVGTSVDPSKLESAEELGLYLKASYFALSSPREIALRDEAEGIYRALLKPGADVAALRREVAAL